VVLLRRSGVWPSSLLVVALAAVAGGASGCGAIDSALGEKAYRIPSPSMDPAVAAGSTVLVDLDGYELVRRGIYVYHPNGHGDTGVPRDEVSSVKYLKRIVGLPGEWIQARDGHVQICTGPGGRGCKTISEPYVSSTEVAFGPTHIPPGRYFVMGDNRAYSDDSRATGAIGASQFIGRYERTLKT
jgi:signal peptidase I